jgi:hypothetical protein
MYVRLQYIDMLHKYDVKGTVQQKLTGIKSDINKKVLLLHWTADIFFVNFKGTCSLNGKKLVSTAKAKICGLFNSMGRPLQLTDSRNRLTVIVPIGGISLPLQFKQISSGTPISTISQ